jgi:TonB family protein
MNPKKILLAAGLTVGLLSTAGFATTIDAHDQIIASTNLVAPVPVKIVNPVNLPFRFENETVTLSLTIDAAGVPHNIKVVSRGDHEASQSLVSAVSQWKFTPGLLNGVPVTTRVTLPVELKGA